jgi:hypothetical protein
LTIVLVAGAATLRAQPLGYGIAGPAGVAGFFAASASEIHAAGGGELRDHVRLDTRGTVQYWSLRGGIVFR